MTRLVLIVWIALTGFLNSAPVDMLQEEAECACRMRKVSEAIQVYRRTHNGEWPESLSPLKTAGLLRAGEDCCPQLSKGRAARNPQGLWTNRSEGLDADSMYQYDLASINELPEWRKAKLMILQRLYFEQVPVLRCQRHGSRTLNMNATGSAFTNPHGYWESLFVDDVPLPYRGPYLVLKRPVPPFSAGLPERSASLTATAVNLAAACNAFPDDPWWWGAGVFDGKPTPTLSALLAEFPNGVARIQGITFDVRAIVQVGTSFPNSAGGTAYRSHAFPLARKGLALREKARSVALLMGTVWDDKEGKPVGKLVWHFASGKVEYHTLVYGLHTARFNSPSPKPSPSWTGEGENGPVHLWVCKWENPLPEEELKSVDILAEESSPASPFVVGITLIP